MLDKVKLENILFLDIETVPEVESQPFLNYQKKRKNYMP